MAALVLVGQYWQELNAFKLQLQAAGQPIVGMNTPASILCPFPALTQTNMGWVVLVEFFVDTYISLVIWACLDPANPFMSPVAAPFAIGLAFASMIWGFVDVTISTNTARDLGTRIVAAIFYGRGAFTYRNYSPIAILVNIPAFFFATFYYELVLRDSLQKIKKGHAVHEEGEEGLKRHLTKTGTLDLNEPMEQGVTRAVENPNNQTNGYQNAEKVKE
jgi:glycerol uptake facilitator-like aquaporin